MSSTAAAAHLRVDHILSVASAGCRDVQTRDEADFCEHPHVEVVHRILGSMTTVAMPSAAADV